ncbi:DUF2332 domain-containing protein [Sporosarcina sp. Marseille-Q4063]|uniref:DUF2332 domain-containing protein n=1 Tax=Sporosarcina sp. Marseille-Q4063 TaxID=2810514 RepID=UPI00201678B3|nr:DUF2332 domain-containing protein [Sporosarcina sp. Marseille-Q4063]
MVDITRLANEYRVFADVSSSILYEYLSNQITADSELLNLSSFAREGQPVPNLLFGAVQLLLYKGVEHSLRDYYPNMVEHPKDYEESFSHFKDFCRIYREEIISLLKVKLVQTNEARRCAYLYPVFSHIYNKANKPIALIEIGTSAGFQLLWDQYSYTYQSEIIYGNSQSDIRIQSEIKGDNRPELQVKSPPVAQRIGIDLHINDVTNDEDSLWLKSLIWPEHDARRGLFNRAVNCLTKNKHEIKFIEGDGVECLLKIVEQIPNNAVICVFHTHVANQITKEKKFKLLDTIKNIGEKRDVFHIYNNIWDGKLHLDYFINKIEYKKIVGETDAHGKWFTWNL